MKRIASFAFLVAAIAAAMPAAATPAPQQRDAFGAQNDVASFCRAIASALHGYGTNRETEFRHVVVGGYAAGTLRMGADVFNVTAARTPNGWTEPYSVGPVYPAIESLTATGMPATTARSIFVALQRLNAVPPSKREAPCT